MVLADRGNTPTLVTQSQVKLSAAALRCSTDGYRSDDKMMI